MRGAAALLLALTGGAACGVPRGPELSEKVVHGPLRISELMSKNEGAWLDERGETDDWIELSNLGDAPISLAGYTIADDGGTSVPLPEVTIAGGDALVLWPDDDPDQGLLHLPFKLSSESDSLELRNQAGELIERIEVPELAPNEAWTRLAGDPAGFSSCMWSTPGRANEPTCGPPAPPSIDDDIEFSPFTWPDPWPEPPAVAINELSLDLVAGEGFVELFNNTDTTIALAQLRVEVAATHPSQPWPDSALGVGESAVLELPALELAPGIPLAIALDATALALLADSPNTEGVVTVFADDGEVVDRLDFVHWPAGAALTRLPDGHGYAVFCAETTADAPNDACDPLASRPLSGYVRHLRTPGDFAALAAGGGELGLESVKIVQDLELGDQIYFLDAAAWDLHFTFTREVIDGLEPLDLCDPEQLAQFRQEWGDFSDVNYGDGPRRYLLTTASRFGGSQLQAVEYFPTDLVSAEQMKHGYLTAMAHFHDREDWSLHVHDTQIERALTFDGELPIVGPNAPYAGLEYQPLNQVVGYGVLEFVPAAALAGASLGPQTIVVTDLVPNDIPFVGGLITESFQTPLSHVNVLSKNRGLPNMALADARTHPDVAPWFGELVRLEVGPTEFSITAADPAEAAAFWEEQQESGPPQIPAIDTGPRGVVSLETVGLEALPAIGGKAAQLAELAKLDFAAADDVDACAFQETPGASKQPTGVTVATPAMPFAIPVVHSIEHLEASGAAARLAELAANPDFLADPGARAVGLAQVRGLILAHPVDPELLAEVEATIAARYGDDPVRFRSSSNTEDLAGFSGAGLYTSTSGRLGDPDEPIDDAIRTVWASLWNDRAWDERAHYNIEQTAVAMGVLCHAAFRSEHANGVGVSRDITDPDDDGSEYVNVQFGEATVTNPAPGIVADQLVHHWWADAYLTRSTFAPIFADTTVLTARELRAIDCALTEIQEHYATWLDPDEENDWFTMEIEFKLIGEARQLMIKQARPYSFGRAEPPSECP